MIKKSSFEEYLKTENIRREKLEKQHEEEERIFNIFKGLFFIVGLLFLIFQIV